MKEKMDEGIAESDSVVEAKFGKSVALLYPDGFNKHSGNINEERLKMASCDRGVRF